MKLTIEILSSISKHIEASSEGSGLVLAYIYSEMYRLQHGSFVAMSRVADGLRK